MLGFLNPEKDPRHPTGKRHSDGPVSLIFGGSGLMFEGLEVSPEPQPASAPADGTEGAGQSRQELTCPTPQFTPPSPNPNLCPTADCLVTFKGYQWWTNYQFFQGEAATGTSTTGGAHGTSSSRKMGCTSPFASSRSPTRTTFFAPFGQPVRL